MPEWALYMKGFLIIKNVILSKQTLLLVYILVWGMQAYGSANLSSIFPHNYRYKSFKNIYFPLESNIVNAIFQDDTGLTWIGTKSGLFSYDGYQIYKLAKETDIEYANITAIVQISKEYLCIGTNRGLRFLNLLTEQFENLYPATQVVKSVRSLAVWHDKLWIGTNDEGLLYYDFQNGSILHLPLGPGKSKSIVYAFAPANGKLYIGSYDGLSCYDPVKQVRETVSLPEQFRKLMVNSLLWDEQQNCLWIGAEGCLLQYSFKDSHVETSLALPSNTAKTLAFDNKNNIVIGTDNGLYIYSRSLRKVNHVLRDLRNEQSLCNNVISCIYVDKNNNVWLGTDYGISLIIDDSAFQFIHISELINERNGNHFTHIYKDSKGGYWLGGTNGLLLFGENGDVKCFNTETPDGLLLHNRIRCIYEDRDRIMWIATDAGVARYDRKKKEFIHYNIVDRLNQKKANWAYDVYENKYGYLWITTYLGGIFIVDKQELLAHDHEALFRAEWNLSDSLVSTKFSEIAYQIEADNYGFMWVNTQKGLARIDCKSRKTRILDIGLNQMIYDGIQSIWYSSDNELYRINVLTCAIEKIGELAKGSLVHSFVLENKNIWVSCTEGVMAWDVTSLQRTGVAFPGRYYQAGFYDKQHEVILWGGYDGISYMPTHAIKKEKKASPVIITAVRSNDRRLLPMVDYIGSSIRYQNRIELPHTEKNLTFEFSTLAYSSETEFYYRLGNTKQWNKLEPGRNYISFANLHSGRYKLLMRSGNSDNPRISPVTEFGFTILPPWYASVIAYIIYTLILVGIAFIIIKYIRRNIKLKYERIEKEKTLELSNLKLDFFIHISHELKTPLSLIIAPLSTLITEIKKPEHKKRLESVYGHALKLNSLIHEVLDFKQIDCASENTLIRSNIELCSFTRNILDTFSMAFASKNIRPVLISDREQIWMNLDMIKMESVISNIITNAIKFIPAEGGKIEVSIIQEAETVTIQISDTGSGIRHEDLPYVFIRYFQSKNKERRKDGSGIGLYIVKKFIELHDGHVSINSAGDKCGTLVTVTLPLSGANCISSVQNSFQTDQQLSLLSGKPILLIVDDNVEMVTYLVEAFSKEYCCLYALNGKDGIAIASEHHPDIILVDQIMPEMDGIEFCKVIRKKMQIALVPIAMLTAKDDKDTELKSMKAGVDAFIAKPFDIDKLELRLEQLLKTRRRLEKRLSIETIGQPVQIQEKEIDTGEAFITKLVAIMEENMENTEFNVSMLCQLVEMDNKQLYRKVKQLVGVTPVDLIRRIRMKKAAALLSQNRFSVSEVMYMVGYSNPSYFSKCFVAEYKVSPSQYASEDQNTLRHANGD